MKNTKFLLLLIAWTSSFSQENHKQYIDYNGRQILVAEGKYSEQNKKEGQWVYYHTNVLDSLYPSKNIKSKVNYKNGRKNGDFRSFYESGVLKEEGVYFDNQEGGTWKRYYENGNINSISEQKGTNLVYLKIFNRQGILTSTTVPKKNGDGLMTKSFNEDGSVNAISIQNGEEEYVKTYNSKGQLEEEKKYVNNKLNGERKDYTYGKLTQIMTFRDGFQEGPYIAYHPESGDVLVKGSFKNSEQHGTWKHYHEGDILSESTTYYLGTLNGPHKSYRFGKLEKEGNYKNGKKDGEWRYYNIKGVLKTTEHYNQGKLIE